MRTSLRRFIGAAVLALAMTVTVPLTASAGESADAPRSVPRAERVPTSSVESEGPGYGKPVDGVSPKSGEKADGTKAAWGYQIMPSCSGLEGLIRQGAAFWQGATETPGSGKPVECTNGYIANCFGTINAVGCNYGPGQMMLLSTRVSDFALLAAHEFGHEWHPHSAAGCMNWASAYEVMRPTMC